MVLSISPVLLSHSAWQIQCRFERSRTCRRRPRRLPQGSKSDSRHPVTTSRSLQPIGGGFEFWRFVLVQQEVAKLAQTAIDFPPMQNGASFNLEAVKEQIEKAMQSRAGR